MAYVQKNNPVPKTGCGRRRLSGMKNPFKSKALESVSKGLKKASNTHAGQAKKIDKYLESSPAKFGIENRGMDSAAKGTKGIGPDGKPLKMKGKKMGPRRTPRDGVRRSGTGSRLEVARTDRSLEAQRRRASGGNELRKLVDKNKDKSPMKGKLKPCQKAAAKKKFDVYPSAYANMWASNHKC